MSLFDITHWTDYVRDLVDGPTREQMEAQLGLDVRARRTADALRRLAEVARLDLELEVPDGALRSVYALAGQRRPEAAPATPEGLLGQLFGDLVAGLGHAVMSLTSDSALAPAAVGVRDARSMRHRQLFYELDDVAVELRYEAHANGGVVVGQLMGLGDEPRPLADVEWVIAAGDEVLARRTTGALGEFQADGLPTGDLSLYFVLGGSSLEVPLPQNDR